MGVNDKKQLAAIGAQYRLTEEQAKGLAERMPKTGTLEVIDDEPLCTEIRINGVEACGADIGGLLDRCLPHTTEQKPLCMAKRIEELEAQLRVMAELLREARKYVTALGKPDDEVSAVQMTVSRIDALLAGQVQEPVYYMRDNHTFKRLSNDVDTAITEIEAELDAGWTSGMLCSKRKGFSSLHANYRRPREEFISDCRDAMLAAAPMPEGGA